MTLLWTKSRLPIGPLICWGLESKVSHFAVLFNNALVLQSNFFGVHILHINDFLKYSDIIYKKEYALLKSEEATLLTDIMSKYYGKRYDWKWFFNLVWNVILFKFFRINNMDNIKWRSRDKFLCTEIVTFLESIIGKVNVGNGSPIYLAKNLGVI